jgi:uncharacterized LabA/DUF88 family protein
MFFIDGYNLYHPLDSDPALRKYKWLDLKKLALCFSQPPYEDLQSVKYFTAYAEWRTQSAIRHKIYTTVLSSVGVDIILGRFQEKPRMCMALGGCGKRFKVHEEKMTDVNIAVSILEACVNRQCDILYLVSGDNDLVPALETARKLCAGIDITVVLPPAAKAKTITKTCRANNYAITKISPKFLAASQFPDQVTINGKTYIKPLAWN